MNSTHAVPKQYLDVKEAAEFLGLATSTLYSMVSQRRIPYVKMGRRTKFDRRHLDEWLKQGTVLPRQFLTKVT
jgi:excisionase family DNA binding protein